MPFFKLRQEIALNGKKPVRRVVHQKCRHRRFAFSRKIHSYQLHLFKDGENMDRQRIKTVQKFQYGKATALTLEEH